ncbi:MAG: acyl carrier protein [Gemmataceae bacterium]
MDRDAIRTLVIQLIEDDIGQRFPDLEDNKDLRKDLGLDSVDLVSVVSQVERRFKIRLAQEELEKLVTVKDVLDLLEVKFAHMKSAA